MNDLDLVVERTGHTRFRSLVRDRPEYATVVAEMARSFRGLPALPKRVGPTEPALDQWTYVTTAQLVHDTLALLARLPADIDAVVAVARSGLLPGTLAATNLHTPLWTVSRGEGLSDPGHGFRMDGHQVLDPAHVLLIDDTAATGREMPAATALVRGRWPAARITRAVVYCSPQARGQVDLCAYLYSGAHYLEWNWPNAGHGMACAYDFDGILCRDFTDGEVFDEVLYRETMARIEPRFLPRKAPVPLIATMRHERHREITQDWLARHGVRCERLAMRNWEFNPARDWNEQAAAWKAARYGESTCLLFAESDPDQAQRIAELSGRAVLCPRLGRVIPAAVRPTVKRTATKPPPIQCEHRIIGKVGCCATYICRIHGGRHAPVEVCEECPDQTSLAIVDEVIA